jgi:type I restriction enzyme S subunit
MNRLAEEEGIKGPWKLPDEWSWVRIGDICSVNPRRPVLNREGDTPTSFLPMAGVDEVSGTIASLEIKPFREVARGFTYFEDGDVLFAKITPSMQNGKSAVARDLLDGIGFGSTEFHVLRPKEDVTADWIHRFVRRQSFRLEAKEHFRGAVGQQRVPDDFLKSSLIPVPPSIEIQNRIVNRIEALTLDLKESREILAQMRKKIGMVFDAALQEVMADLNDSPSSLRTLGELISERAIKVTGGGTPSKSRPDYWVGSVPWVSPKDMKHWYISDSQDHISSSALEETAVRRIPERSVLIVVRGMILAHTLPVGITMTEVTINQDMKALTVGDGLIADYLAYVLRARASSILQQVEIAAHGTRRLKTETLQQVRIPCIPVSSQRQVVAHLDSVRDEVNEMSRLVESDTGLVEQVEQSILEHAFQGKL